VGGDNSPVHLAISFGMDGRMIKAANSEPCWAGTCVDARQTIAAPIQPAEAILRTLSFDLLMAAFLPETTINLGTVTEFGTQMTSSQQVQVPVVERCATYSSIAGLNTALLR
jgi:hypothetical protein